jgi:SAM-dependent methyltransferase
MRWPSEDLIELLLPNGAFPLRYVTEGGELWLIASDDGATWPVEVLRRGAVSVRTQDGTATLGARLVIGRTAREAVLARFRQRFGEGNVAGWFPNPGRMLRLSPALAAPDDPYRAWLVQEFESAAETYAPRILANPVEAQARRRSASLLARTFHARHRLLELGSGPGLETVPLLRAGHEIVAVDASSAMLRQLESRAEEAGVRERLTTVTRDVADLADLAGGTFDGAYSTFGALNCVADLAPLRRALSARLRPGAPLVAGVYNRVSLPEIGWYGLGGRPARALARLRTPVPVGHSRFSVDWYPRTSADVERSFAPDFRREGTDAIGVVAPPPEILKRFDWSPRLLSGLLRADDRLDRSWLGRWFGDQLMVELRRVGPAS